MNIRDDIDVLVKKAIPLFAILFGCIGGACFTIFAPIEMVDRTKAIQYSAAGVLGTLFVVSLVRKSLQTPHDEVFFGMRGRLVAFILCLCWGIGAIVGFIMFYYIPRHSA